MGWLPAVARVAARAPGLVNRLTHVPGLAALAKRAGGLAPQREIPRFAPVTFQAWFSRREDSSRTAGREVILWPDTFTNHFDPGIGRSAVAVLEDAGFRVTVPAEALCCGLTWISTGQLKTAQRILRRTLRALAPELERGVPVVGLEPSCTAVFRSDLCELFPHDEDAKRLSKHAFTLAEFLTGQAEGWERPHVGRRAIVQGHCHHKAVMEMAADEQLYSQVGLDAEVLDSGCCGLAGNFGFERGHYDVSIACGERVLLPEVRNAPTETIVMADGFSCRTQIQQNTGRRALHLAEVLEMALREDSRSTGTRRTK